MKTIDDDMKIIDSFAKEAMGRYLTYEIKCNSRVFKESIINDIAERSYLVAIAMVKQRAKTKEQIISVVSKSKKPLT